MSKEKFDFIGFGALNVDNFYSVSSGRKVQDILAGLTPGGELIGNETEREYILGNAQRYSALTGRSGGGQAANTAVALSRMGFRCGFIGMVGDDEMGGFLLDSLESVDKSHIHRSGNSGTCLCILDENGERANIVFSGCNDNISLDDADVKYARSCKVLYLTSFCSEGALDHQKHLLEKSAEETIIAFDPGEIYSRHGIDRLKGILSHIDMLFVTSEELMMMTGKAPQEAARDVIEYGAKTVICKMGEKGSGIITKTSMVIIPVTKAKKVVDKTGAGDVYAAGFIAGLLRDLPIEFCGKLASQAAALSISGYGRDKYPDQVFLNEWLST